MPGSRVILRVSDMGKAGVQDTQGLVKAGLLLLQNLLLVHQHSVHLAQQPYLTVPQALQVATDGRVDLALDLNMILWTIKIITK